MYVCVQCIFCDWLVCDWADVAEKRLCVIMSGILNYLRFKTACDEDFRDLKSKLVSELMQLKLPY